MRWTTRARSILGRAGVSHQGRLAALLAAGLAGLVPGCGADPAPSALEVRPGRSPLLLVLFDGLAAGGASHLGAERPTTPNLDALAAEGVTFESVHAPASYPLAALPSLLTGRLPAHHGVLVPGDELPPRAPRLPTSLAEDFRLVRLPEDPDGPPVDPARLAQDLARALEGGGVAPLLAFVRFAEPRRSAPGHADAARWAPGREPQELLAMERAAEAGELPFANREAVRALHDARIRRADAALGEMLAALRRAGAYDDFLVVATSPCGRALWEHGELGGETQVHAETVRVPLVVKFPAGRGPRALRVAGLASTLDVVPSLCSWLQVLPPPRLDGLRLDGLILGDDRRFDSRELYVRGRGARPALALVTPHLKSILVRDRGDRPMRTDSFDLELDPEERRPLTTREVPGAAHALSKLSKFDVQIRQRGLARKTGSEGR